MRFVTRSEWGSVHGRGNRTSGVKRFVFIHHAAQKSPEQTLAAECARWRAYEVQHARDLTPTNPRIGYTVGFTQSGNILEGTGLGYIGAHTALRNSSGWGACFLLDGRVETPSIAAMDAYKWWIAQAQANRFLDTLFVTRGHRDEVNTTCPGDKVYDLVVRRLNAIKITGSAAVLPRPTLRRGSGGPAAPEDLREAVRQLQRMMGMSDKHRTGYFADVTSDCVTAFQLGAGLKTDGIVGPITWQALITADRNR